MVYSCACCSDLRARLDWQGQNWHERPLRDGEGGKGNETHENCAARPQPGLEREVHLVSIFLPVAEY